MLVIDQCQYGLTSVTDDGREVPALKPTKFMANCPGMKQTLNRRCNGPNRCREHSRLEGGQRTRQAQVYPRGLCEALVEGVKIQKKRDSGGIGLLADGYHLGSLGHAGNAESDGSGKLAVPKEEEDHNVYLQDAVAWDDVNGSPLDPDMVRAARMEEIQFYRRMGVYVKVPLEECYQQTGRAPVGVKWVDHNKGDRERPNYRSRFVGQYFNDGTDACAFAATQPLDTLRVLLSSATTGDVEKSSANSLCFQSSHVRRLRG